MDPVLDPRYVDALTLPSIEESDHARTTTTTTPLACTALYVHWCSSVVVSVVVPEVQLCDPLTGSITSADDLVRTIVGL